MQKNRYQIPVRTINKSLISNVFKFRGRICNYNSNYESTDRNTRNTFNIFSFSKSNNCESNITSLDS